MKEGKIKMGQQLTAQQRNAFFHASTRQTWQTLGSKKGDENTVISFDLPKARLLSKIRIAVDMVVKTVSSSSTVTKAPYSPYGVISKIDLNLNNGFAPFTLTGEELSIYNRNRLFPQLIEAGTNKKSVCYVENGASTTGVNNKISFVMDLPITLNDRDSVGLVLLQNQETMVTLDISVGQVAKAYKLISGETAQLVSMTITPLLETFTIPASQDAFPDISVLKLVQSRYYNFSKDTTNTFQLLTGVIYRKLFFRMEDEQGNPLTDEDFNGQLELVFNTADIPYSVKPRILSAINAQQLGFALPEGVYMLDFSFQGIANYGGSRDYIDTEKLTQFEVRFTPTKAGKLTVIPEMLSRLV